MPHSLIFLILNCNETVSRLNDHIAALSYFHYFTYCVPFSSLTLSDSVKHHSDLLIVKQSLLQKLDKHPIGEATWAQLKGLSVLAPLKQKIKLLYSWKDNINTVYINFVLNDSWCFKLTWHIQRQCWLWPSGQCLERCHHEYSWKINKSIKLFRCKPRQ